jgi:hypothetical protein
LRSCNERFSRSRAADGRTPVFGLPFVIL